MEYWRAGQVSPTTHQSFDLASLLLLFMAQLHTASGGTAGSQLQARLKPVLQHLVGCWGLLASEQLKCKLGGRKDAKEQITYNNVSARMVVELH